MSLEDGAPSVSVVIVTHNSAERIGATLDAVLAGPSAPSEVVVVDSASSDGTAAVVAGYPVHWHPVGENRGFGAAANAGAAIASGAVIVVLTHDAVPAPGWLAPLVAALDRDGVGAAMPTIELAGKPGHFNTSGGALAYFGLAWVTDLGEPVPDDSISNGPVEVPFPSGAAFAIKRSVWDALGGFRGELFMYHEDTDLGWRLRMRGLKPVRVPESRVAHDYEFSRNPGKLHLLERNRLYLLATNYRWTTTLLLAPALAVVELGVMATALRDGWLRAKLAAWAGLFRMGSIVAAHRRSQAGRVVGDAAIMAHMVSGVSGIPVPEARPPRGSRLVDAVLGGYLRLVLPLIRRGDARVGLR